MSEEVRIGHVPFRKKKVSAIARIILQQSPRRPTGTVNKSMSLYSLVGLWILYIPFLLYCAYCGSCSGHGWSHSQVAHLFQRNLAAFALAVGSLTKQNMT